MKRRELVQANFTSAAREALDTLRVFFRIAKVSEDTLGCLHQLGNPSTDRLGVSTLVSYFSISGGGSPCRSPDSILCWLDHGHLVAQKLSLQGILGVPQGIFPWSPEAVGWDKLYLRNRHCFVLLVFLLDIDNVSKLKWNPDKLSDRGAPDPEVYNSTTVPNIAPS